MRIPETDNIHFQYAFKKGYRMAVNGKNMNHMPSDIRRDMELRQYFQQGWEQAIDDVNLAQKEMSKPDWRHRFIWFAIMIVGGLATAAHIINRYETEIAEQKALINGTAESQNTANNSEEAALINNQQPLSLLNEAQRQDLKLNQVKPIEQTPLEPVVESSIVVSEATIAKQVEDRRPIEPLGKTIPKYIREVYFFTELKNAKGQTIFHRWRTDKEILATIELKVTTNKYRTWSSKKLASAWQGQWYVEILNEQGKVIYRTSFVYGNEVTE